ncbi:response regulator containing a CheY-like receiver domain and an HTH DNA-binding domain [Serratia sp. FGI94]|uniref:response regulator transcription factor n=1 Tax=Serratia sp. FGI94 TaxID=671990 RepID=UPI0002A703C2|nr:helix-turn-helix transcriptional regulator [Serratia sp. FGI94]AGB80475.1 response regulator containing a CheY-like receiver domain and an HTH DNA-binding domain [Serratia sp. FGI94]
MNAVTTLAVLDDNRYFAAGLQKALTARFYAAGIETRVLEGPQAYLADLLFHYFSPVSPSCFCRYAEKRPGAIPLYFAVRQAQDHDATRADCCLQTGVIVQNMPVAAALWQVENALLQRRISAPVRPFALEHCPCQRYALTEREREIMLCLRQEMRITEIARRLAISVKTASQHKINVMHKMGFRRNAELYDWLRQGFTGEWPFEERLS